MWLRALAVGLTLGSLSCSCGNAADPTTPNLTEDDSDRSAAELELDADTMRLNLCATAPPLDPQWQGIGHWTPARAKSQDKEANLLAVLAAGKSPAAASALGKLYAELGNFDRGLHFLCQALETDASDPGSWAWLALHQLRTDHPRAALTFSGRALELNSDFTAAHELRAEAFGVLNLREEAEAAWRSALDCNPRSFEANLGLAELLEDQGDFEAALACLERARIEDPDHPTPLFGLARLLRNLGRGDEAAQMDQLHERAIILDDLRMRENGSSQLEQQLALGMHFLADQRFEAAKREFTSALHNANHGPARVQALAGLVLIARSQGNSEEVSARLGDLEKVDPDHALLRGDSE